MVIIILLAMLTAQVIWAYHLYRVQHSLLTQVRNDALQTAILQEHTYRHEAMGGTIVSMPPKHRDTARYYTKTIKLIDTSYNVIFDRQDPYNSVKLSQFILKDHMPLNITMLDSLYKQELIRQGLKEVSTFVEYIDLKDNTVLQSSKASEVKSDYTPTEIKVIDIFKTLGIRGYLQVSFLTMLGTMAFQLAVTLILIVICIAFLATIIRTFFIKEKAEEMRQGLVNCMTHEFKRPISVAMAQIALIPHYLENGKTDKVQHYAKNSLLELQKLTSYTERIQKFSNNQQKTIMIDKEPIDLLSFFNELVDKYKKVKDKKVNLELYMQPDLPPLYADLLHFSNIMDNLIENAIKYSRNDAVQIVIHVTQEKQRFAISIKDNGLGISKKDLPHIFDKFFRSESKQTRGKMGFGLGLTYVKAMVDAHQGEVRVTSTLGEGSTFSIYLPIENHAEQDITD